MKLLKPLATVAATGAIALGTLAVPSGEVKAAEGDFDLTIMHSNDTHAHLSNVPRKVSLVEQLRTDRENSILLSAGDVFSGTLFYNQYKGLADVKFMNMMDYDAMVPGNHEFDDGPAPLADFIEEAEFPIVSSNIDYSKETRLSGMYKNEIGSPGEGGNIYPASIIDVDGEKVGVFGLTTEETEILSNPGDKISFQGYLQKAEDTVTLLEEAGVNKIVALTHLGVTYDETLAQDVEGIDVIVGGHSHTQLDQPQVFNDGEGEEPTIVVQADEYNNYLGDLQVTFDEQGLLQDWEGNLIEIDAENENGEYVYPSDPEAQELLTELEGPVEELKQEVVGETAVPLNGERKAVRQMETNLGNLITDGMLAKAKEAVPSTTIAIQNGGGIRASIDKGDITMGEVLTTMPFGNTLVTLALTGEQIWAALENGVSDLENMGGRFAQVSGLQYTFDRSKEQGDRIVDVKVKTEKGYEAIDLEKEYTVATNAFIADGGDGYASFKEAKEAGKMTELFFVDYQVFNEYLDEQGTVSPEKESRIIEKETERVNGEDRYQTSVEISKKGWDQADTVVIARGDEFADALTGAPLAYKEDAPILLTKTGQLSKAVKEEIARLGAAKAIILGGPNAVSPYVKYELKGLGLDIDRIYGDTRFKTAASIAARLGGNPENVVVADGYNFPDALAVAPYAAKQGYPILLSKTNELPSITKVALRDFNQSIVVGGPGAVSEEVAEMLPEPVRYNGTTRYETAAVIAKELSVQKGKAYVATGQEFADALSGSVLAAKEDASMLLVKTNQLPEVAKETIDQLDIYNFQVLGGLNAVSDEVADQLEQD